MMRLLLCAAVLVLLADAAVFARVAWNRGGEPQTITLTERELILPYYYSYNRDDNSGLNLQLEWRVAPVKLEDRYWQYDHRIELDAQKFLGFGFHPMENCDGMSEYPYRHRHELPVRAWAALEYDGAAHANVVRQLRERSRNPGKEDDPEQLARELEQLEHRETRLYVVEVAADKDELTAKYRGSAKHMILPATLSNGSDCTAGKYKVYVSDILTDTVHVPAPHHPLFSDLPERPAGTAWFPAYRITLAIGKLAEPWLLKVERDSFPPH